MSHGMYYVVTSNTINQLISGSVAKTQLCGNIQMISGSIAKTQLCSNMQYYQPADQW